MFGERKVLVIVLFLVALAVGIFLLLPQVEEHLAPQPLKAWVAVEPEGSGIARVGWLKLEQGTPFKLHAVLEALDRNGGTVYYTEARALEIGGQEVPAEALRPWDRHRPPKILWFTVEGAVRQRTVSDLEQLGRFALQEVYRPDWPHAWTIPGSLESSRVAAEERPFRTLEATIGTQRFHVRIEVYEDDKALLPKERYKSWGADSLPETVADFPAVTASAPGLLGPGSEVFGLSQLEPETLEPALLEGIESLSRQRLAFSRLSVLAETVAVAGLEPEDLSWSPLDISSGAAWGEEVHAGDLLQVLERMVVLFEDRGNPGILDAEDLCFDFAQGAGIRQLGQVFVGGGEVSWVPLHKLTGAAANASRPASQETSSP
jgi:hypothetical protein